MVDEVFYNQNPLDSMSSQNSRHIYPTSGLMGVHYVDKHQDSACLLAS